MVREALIGYTGFVGGNILAQHSFASLYNSKNSEEIQGQEFDLVVSAGVSAVKWLANKEPENDRAGIARLIENLKKIKTKKFVLISTIDVYSTTADVDEGTVIDKGTLAPYGKHRRELEEFVANNFDALIVRLPGIYGPGMKKNPLFDLLHESYTYIHHASQLQFYDLRNIWADITSALDKKLKLVNFVTEPVTLKEIADQVFHVDISTMENGQPQHYDIRTKHGAEWGNVKSYLYTKEAVLAGISSFVASLKK